MFTQFGFSVFSGFFSEFIFVGLIDQKLKLIGVGLFHDSDVFHFHGDDFVFVVILEGQFDFEELVFVLGDFEVKGVSIAE